MNREMIKKITARRGCRAADRKIGGEVEISKCRCSPQSCDSENRCETGKNLSGLLVTLPVQSIIFAVKPLRVGRHGIHGCPVCKAVVRQHLFPICQFLVQILFLCLGVVDQPLDLVLIFW